MLLIHVTGGPGIDVRHEWFDTGSPQLENDPWLVPQLSIGEVFSDLQLPGLRPHHLLLDQPRPGEVVVRLASPVTEIFIDGNRAWDGARLGLHQSLRFENYTLSYSRTQRLSPGEIDRLAAITPGGEEWRVLADEIEEAGKANLASWMRLNRVVTPETRAELAELGRNLMPSERAMVGTSQLHGCELKVCPGRWEALAVTDEPRFRSCAHCKRAVPYCATVREATPFVRMFKPAALDSGEEAPREWPQLTIG